MSNLQVIANIVRSELPGTNRNSKIFGRSIIIHPLCFIHSGSALKVLNLFKLRLMETHRIADTMSTVALIKLKIK